MCKPFKLFEVNEFELVLILVSGILDYDDNKVKDYESSGERLELTGLIFAFMFIFEFVFMPGFPLTVGIIIFLWFPPMKRNGLNFMV